MDLVIYGAQGIALGAYEAICNLCPTRKIRCFLVTERGMNAEYLAGIPVLELKYFSQNLSVEEKEKTEVLIATPEAVMCDIEKSLDEQGLFCHVRLTSAGWAKLMSYYYACRKEYMPLSAFPTGYHRADIHLFMAKFYKDRPLNSNYNMPEWVIPVQAGAALCEERVAAVLDCDGENISGKNGNYSELTVLYWIWKNPLSFHSVDENHQYYGLMHYRRVLELTEEDLFRLADNDVDVVLPYPMIYEPDMEAHHERYVKKEDWDAVKAAIAELQPEYEKALPEVMKKRFFYNYNILLARKRVLKKYCSWLFPILERVEELSDPKAAYRSDRYLGYIGESLATLYFMYNADKLNIAHTGCIFLM